MGGKKKSLANKLAKMSDEERARYLKHKADMEEEERRRKEQLIATFLKKKIKREEMFSRLNLAKINQHWHRILRKSKCEEMKENIEHMKNWIERAIEYKNRTILKLMEELEEAEEQYSNNFQSHSTYIDIIIEHQHQYIKKMQDQYNEDLKNLLDASKDEKESIEKSAKIQEEYLKTIVFAQQIEGKKALRAKYEYYKQKEYENESVFEEQMEALTVSRGEVSNAIWRQIATVVDLYVDQVSCKRTHFAKLRRVDAESAIEIDQNEKRIKKQEELIENLRSEYKSLFTDRDLKLKTYRKELNHINSQFLNIKKQLQKELQIDEKKLKFLSETSSFSLSNLETLKRKGDQIKNLAATCEKLKTQREVLARWLPVSIIYNEFINTGENVEDQTIGEALEAELVVKDEDTTLMENLEDTRKSILRPKTSVERITPKSSPNGSVTSPDFTKETTVKKVVLQSNRSQDKTSTSSEEPSTESLGILERCLTSLKGMENFWFIFSRTEVDFMELKEERKSLEKENKQLRGMIRAVLETCALAQSIPNSRASTRVASRRCVRSAPLRRIVFV